MDKRKIQIIVIGVVGILVLVIGIKAAMIYGEPIPSWAQDELMRSVIVQARNISFNEWIIKWIVRPLGLFLILTGAIVASRVILNKIRD